jgi:hypothetical protein
MEYISVRCNVYYVNLVDESINATQENRESLLFLGKEVDFEAMETAYLLMFHHQNRGTNLSICIANRDLGRKMTNCVN